MKAIDIFEKLLERAYNWSSRMGNHFYPSKRPGVPGEFIQQLPPEEREILKNLKAEDLSEEKIPRGQLWLFPESDKKIY